MIGDFLIRCFMPQLDWAGLGDVDLELAFRQHIVIEHADCLVGFRLGGHRHERKAPRRAGTFVCGDFHRRDGSGGGEQGADFSLRGGLVQVSYVNSNIHFNSAFCPKGHMSGIAGIKMTAAL